MRYYKRSREYKNSTGTLIYDPLTGVATSYAWYVLTTRCRNYPTQIILNTYRYSNTTAKHVSAMRELLNECGIKPIEIEAPNGLQDKDAAIAHYNTLINILTYAINRPRSHKAKNAERAKQIDEYTAIIKFIEGEI
jgi:hypothetical protein